VAQIQRIATLVSCFAFVKLFRNLPSFVWLTIVLLTGEPGVFLMAMKPFSDSEIPSV